MRLSSGKIYFWGGAFMIFITVWNRLSTGNLRSRVDSMREERMKELKDPSAVGARQPRPAHFNPYFKQQELETPTK
ncbi:hypothetical protein AGDE_01107 [Angomonas deanei]|uniref:Uncharacterized protein n=1 Tax=Angomonas deanei TaxID=59799 RepID=S9WNJ4_9TRYP|nr:hypothetical protein AGDE_06379 [Angomonas deanei]EPY42816.1 hypothetical protein AGDE_01107 [Angomonas deanei]CAD2216216.1 hypothetical protein, conserved [Angomonas deanei]|eukprot:EPY37555.1 hypothetical protein AGDE_06379 [Angomonas deanei]